MGTGVLLYHGVGQVTSAAIPGNYRQISILETVLEDER